MSTLATEDIDPFNPPLPDEKEEMERLTRAIRFTDRFALFFVTCDRADLRLELMRRFQEDNLDFRILIVTVDRRLTNLWAYLSDLPEARQADAIFVHGLESFLPTVQEDERSPFVVTLNHARNSFPHLFSCPLVFWQAGYVRNGIMLGAPDFYSVHSAGFDFHAPMPPREIIDRLFIEATFIGAQTMLPVDRLRHEAELRDLLSQAESLPDNEQDLVWQVNLAMRLGQLYIVSGNYSDAEPLFKNALDVVVSIYGQSHYQTATILHNLAYLAQANGNLDSAAAILSEVIRIRKEVLGPSHSEVANALNGIAVIQDGLEIDSAESLYKESIDIFEESLGTNHPLFANSLSNLANYYRKRGNYSESKQLFRRALRIRETLLGSEHPDTASTLNNLAGLYLEQNNFAAAQPLFQKALNIWEKLLGPEHPDTARALCNLARVYELQGNIVLATESLSRAYQIYVKTLGFDHSRTQDIKSRLDRILNRSVFISNYTNNPSSTDRSPMAVLQLPQRKKGKASKRNR